LAQRRVQVSSSAGAGRRSHAWISLTAMIGMPSLRNRPPSSRTCCAMAERDPENLGALLAGIEPKAREPALAPSSRGNVQDSDRAAFDFPDRGFAEALAS
jgi:hypothetical protein